jgi:hypothetical protein
VRRAPAESETFDRYPAHNVGRQRDVFLAKSFLRPCLFGSSTPASLIKDLTGLWPESIARREQTQPRLRDRFGTATDPDAASHSAFFVG